MGDGSSLAKWSSLDLLTEEIDETTSTNTVVDKNGKCLIKNIHHSAIHYILFY